MINAYDHIKVIGNSEEKHLGGSGISMDSIEFDKEFFNGKSVILFDDLITKGHSMTRFKRTLECLGATVLYAVSIGYTKHQRVDDAPTLIDWAKILDGTRFGTMIFRPKQVPIHYVDFDTL